MKLFYTQACMSSDVGTFAPWFAPWSAPRDAATGCDRPRRRQGAKPARAGAPRAQRGRGWAAADSAALSGFR